jgi:AraC family transcriptional regulator
VTPHAAAYPEHHLKGNLLFLCEVECNSVKGRMDSDTFETQVRPADMWVIPSQMPHACEFCGPHGGVVLAIGNETFEQHAGPLCPGGRVELRPRLNLRDSRLESLVRSLIASADGDSHVDSLVSESLISAVCIHLTKYCGGAKAKEPKAYRGLPPMRLTRVTEYIHENMDQKIRLSELADVAGMSLYYFATLFKQSTGVSPHHYLLRERMERAKEMLRKPQTSVFEISMSLGFERQNNFARAFRRMTGLSPSDFRRNALLGSKKIERIGPKHKNG